MTSDDKLPTGDVEIVLEYEQKPFRQFVETTGGTAKLSVNGKVVGSGEIPNVVIGRFSATETLDIGMDLGAVVVPRLSRPRRHLHSLVKSKKSPSRSRPLSR